MECLQMGRNLSIKKNSKAKGSITLEAAIVFPIFIMGILTISYLMKFIYVQENILYSLCKEAEQASKNAYVVEEASLITVNLENRLKSENLDVDYLALKKFKYFYKVNGLDGLIRYRVDFWMDMKLPIKLYSGFPGKETIVFRGLIGSRKTSTPLPFENMENENPSNRVWVFPTEGRKYHKRNCTYIIVLPTETILTNEIKRKYHSCTSCKSKNTKVGNLVYCFYKTGEAYHTGKCLFVDRYVIEMEKETAVSKGYDPCLKCGGAE